MSDKHRLAFAAEGNELFDSFLFSAGALYHSIGYACKLYNPRWDWLFGVDKNIHLVNNIQSPYLNRANFYDAFVSCGKTGCFKVEHDKFFLKASRVRAEDYACFVVDLIRFHAIDDLEFTAAFAYLIDLIHSVREALAYAMVCYGKCTHSPVKSLTDYQVRRRNTVHSGHI